MPPISKPASDGSSNMNGAPRRIRTHSLLLLRQARLPFSPAAHLVGSDGVEPPRSSLLVGYSHAPYRSGNSPLVGRAGFEPAKDTAFEAAAFTDYAIGPENYPSRYRNRKVVWAAGFEPATSRFQGEDSDQAELRPEVVGRGSVGTFMKQILT